MAFSYPKWFANLRRTAAQNVDPNQFPPRAYKVILDPSFHPADQRELQIIAATAYWFAKDNVCGLVGADGRGVAAFRCDHVVGIFEVQG